MIITSRWALRLGLHPGSLLRPLLGLSGACIPQSWDGLSPLDSKGCFSSSFTECSSALRPCSLSTLLLFTDLSQLHFAQKTFSLPAALTGPSFPFFFFYKRPILCDLGVAVFSNPFSCPSEVGWVAHAQGTANSSTPIPWAQSLVEGQVHDPC